MQKGFVNAAFALFAALLLLGSAFASNSTATSANRVPVITSVGGPTTLSAGTAGTWTVSAYDPDGTYLSYSVNWGEGSTAPVSSNDLGRTGSSASFEHTYSAAGTYTITFTATDGAGAKTVSSVTTTVTAASTNRPPSFSSVTCPVTGTSATCYAYANDPDGDPVTYTVNFGDNTGQVSGMQNVFVHSYQMAGAYTINIYAKDKYGAGVGTSLRITVTGDANQKPIISSVGGPATLSVNQKGTWTVSAYDPDGTYLTYSVMWGDGLDQAQAGQIRSGSTATFEHAYSQAGSYMITFTVKDAQGATAQSSAYVNVGSYSSGCDSSFNQLMVGQMLQVPPMTNTYGVKLIDISADSDRAAMVQILDSNEAVLDYAKVAPGIKYIYSGKSGNLAIETCKAVSASNDVNSAWIKGAITTSSGTDLCAGYHTLVQDQVLDVGTFYVRLDGVSTAQGITASQRYANIEIMTPVGAPLEKKEMYPGTSYTYTQPGTSNSVTVKLCDSAYGTAAGKNWVKIDATAVTGSSNLPPVITGVSGPASLAANAAGTWKLSAHDPDGSYINVGIEWGDGSKAANPVSGSLLTFQHTYAQGGKYKIVFTVTDDKGAQAQSSVTVDVISSITPTQKISLKFERGWNMVSVPTNYDIQLADIQKKCDITSAWYYNPVLGQYSAATTFGKGMIGVWMKANSACTYELDAPYITTWSSSLKAGWNMIGAPASGVSFASVAGSCKATSGPWNYSPSAGQYVQSSTLEPGKGYWVKVAADCTLGSASEVPPRAPTD